MLSILHPEVVNIIQHFPIGLLPLFRSEDDKRILVVKASKEVILTAKLNNEFKIYPMYDQTSVNTCLGIISAFFDDSDEPLVITTPLYLDSELLIEFKALLSQNQFEIYFFDETNRELLNSDVVNIDSERFKHLFTEKKFLPFESQGLTTVWKKMHHRFAIRDISDDDVAFSINLSKRIYPDDYSILDTTTHFNVKNIADGLVVTNLERQESGSMQEYDIALLMQRLFDSTNIYLNPHRVDSNRELTDVLILNDDYLIFIQAKDSPNVEKILRRNTSRKRSTIKGHIGKAADQIEGTIKYVKNHDGLTIQGYEGSIKIELHDRQIIGIVVVKELFDKDYAECSLPILRLIHQLEVPIALLDFGDLNTLTHHFKSPDSFVIDGIYKIVNKAIELKQFPRPVWAKPPVQPDL